MVFPINTVELPTNRMLALSLHSKFGLVHGASTLHLLLRPYVFYKFTSSLFPSTIKIMALCNNTFIILLCKHKN